MEFSFSQCKSTGFNNLCNILHTIKPQQLSSVEERRMNSLSKYIWTTILTGCLLVLSTTIHAQRNAHKNTDLTWAESIVIDGDLGDWADTLLNEYTAQDLQYQIKNDDTHVYVAMRVRDKDRQMQVLSQGFSFMVNTNGRKRPGPTVVYPIADRLSFRSIMSADNEDRPEDMREGGLQAIRAIYVLRFDDILDGQISLENQYGIQAEAMIDSADALCFEAKVPLRRLGIPVDHAHILAFNIKINGMIAPRGSNSNMQNMRRRGGYYGYPYGYGGYGQGTPARPREEPGTWLTSTLATSTN